MDLLLVRWQSTAVAGVSASLEGKKDYVLSLENGKEKYQPAQVCPSLCYSRFVKS